MHFDDTDVEDNIDLIIRQLRDQDHQRTASQTDEIYYECLIRTNLDLDKAKDMLANNRPNLVNIFVDRKRDENRIEYRFHHPNLKNLLNQQRLPWLIVSVVFKINGLS